MASGSKERSTFTLDQVTVWREDLFDNRSLRISVEKLTESPLGHYLWAAVLQAADLDRLSNKRHSSTGKHQPGILGASPRLTRSSSSLRNRALAKIKNSIGGQFGRIIGTWTPPRRDGVRRCLGRMPRGPGIHPLTIAIVEAKQSPAVADDNVPAGYTNFLKIARVFAATVTKFVLHAPLS